ncbi:hypothetical protein MOE90_20645 [Bacillus spizizenii]|nr:hypothetical protein [Bacillus spizizenii]MCY9124893.1 hypothetical protein [Bacillus spizizenii]
MIENKSSRVKSSNNKVNQTQVKPNVVDMSGIGVDANFVMEQYRQELSRVQQENMMLRAYITQRDAEASGAE